MRLRYRGVHHKQLLASLSLQGSIRVITSLVPEATGVLQAPSLVLTAIGTRATVAPAPSPSLCRRF